MRPDARVAICMERGLEMVVGLLGILKAGGAYVPLDPSYPVQRLAYMLKDSEPVVLLTQRGLRGCCPSPRSRCWSWTWGNRVRRLPSRASAT